MDLKKLLPYLRYLPMIVAAVSAMTDVVEDAADGNTSAEKEDAALGAVQVLLAVADVKVPDEVVRFVIRGVVAAKNALGVYISKRKQA